MITPETLVPGKYYEVKYTNGTYLCKANKPNNVVVRWVIDRDGYKRSSTTSGGVFGCQSIREITFHYFNKGEEKEITNNKEAKQLLEKEW